MMAFLYLLGAFLAAIRLSSFHVLVQRQLAR